MTEAEVLRAVLEQFGSEEVVSRHRLASVLVELDPEQLTLEATESLLALAGLDKAEEVRVPEFLRWLFGSPPTDDRKGGAEGSNAPALGGPDGPSKEAVEMDCSRDGNHAMHDLPGSLTSHAKPQHMEPIDEDVSFEDMPDLVPVTPCQSFRPDGTTGSETCWRASSAVHEWSATSDAPFAGSSGLHVESAEASQQLEVTIDPGKEAPALPQKSSFIGEVCGEDLVSKHAADGKELEATMLPPGNTDPMTDTPSTAAECPGTDAGDQPRFVPELSSDSCLGTGSEVQRQEVPDQSTKTPTYIKLAVEGQVLPVLVEEAGAEAVGFQEGHAEPVDTACAGPRVEDAGPDSSAGDAPREVTSQPEALKPHLSAEEVPHADEAAVEATLHGSAGLGTPREVTSTPEGLLSHPRAEEGVAAEGATASGAPNGSPRVDAERLRVVLAEFGAEEVVSRGRVEALLRELDAEHFTPEAVGELFSLAGLAETSEVSVQKFLHWVFGGPSPDGGPRVAVASAPMAEVQNMEMVRAQFGGDGLIERSRMVSVLKELDPKYFTDDAINGLFSAAGVTEDGKVEIGEFLAWVFEGGDKQKQPAAAEPTRVFFCRHGETDWNLAHKLQGLTDIPLNDAGREQATCIADALKGEGLAAVWASPLLRARDTAAAVAEAAGVELKTDERLRERNLGVMEGRTGQEVAAEFPEVWAAWKDLQELPPAGKAEPEAEVVARVEAAMFDLAAAHPGKAVAVVAHGAVLRCLCKKTFGNASISTFSVGHGKAWKPVKLDDGSHLKTPGLKV